MNPLKIINTLLRSHPLYSYNILSHTCFELLATNMRLLHLITLLALQALGRASPYNTMLRGILAERQITNASFNKNFLIEILKGTGFKPNFHRIARWASSRARIHINKSSCYSLEPDYSECHGVSNHN